MGAESVGRHRGMAVGEVEGWRHWIVTWEGIPRLRSLGQSYTWMPGDLEADTPPAEGNDNGFYALKTHKQALEYIGIHRRTGAQPFFPGGRYLGYALGAVDMWGEVLEGELGYRAQFARVAVLICLITPRYGSTFKNTSRPHHQQMAELQYHTRGGVIDTLREYYRCGSCS